MTASFCIFYICSTAGLDIIIVNYNAAIISIKAYHFKYKFTYLMGFFSVGHLFGGQYRTTIFLQQYSMIREQESRQESNSSKVSSEKEEEENTFFTSFKQQMLKAWLPVPTLTKTITLFYIMSAIFLGIGIPMLILTNNIVETTVNYDQTCLSNAINCTVTFQVPMLMTAPVFVYYELHNYYQNHRLYTNSISYKQLGGNLLTVSDISSQCKPIVTNADLYVTTSITGATLDPTAPANPCGIVAYTVFNDTFAITDSNGSPVTMTSDGIAWPSDSSRYTITDPSVMWLNTTDPRVMNWMRIATLPNFRKLWARINTDVPAGTYTLTVNNTYTVSHFGVDKFFVMSTSNFFGSRNQFLSIIYLTMGGLCFVIATLFFIRKCTKMRNRKIQHRQ